jgi:rhamnosyltransferase subunit B
LIICAPGNAEFQLGIFYSAELELGVPPVRAISPGRYNSRPMVESPSAFPVHAALVTVGSHGDVHPFVGLGIKLRERGHRVTVLTNEHFAPLVERAGLEFLPIGTDEEYRKIADDPDLWNGRHAFFAVARNIGPLIERVYRRLEELHAAEGDRLVVVASSLAMGARVAQEKLGIPLASVHLSPAVFQSVHEMPRYPGLPLPGWTPRWLKAGLYKIMNRMVDSALAPALNDFRATLGLLPVRDLLRHWWHSPQLVLAMFPEWFGAVQPDWPPETHAIGFPLYDERGLTPMSAELTRCLEGGPPPIAFTPGSAMFHAGDFFTTSAEACRLLGRRGILLSRHREHIPASLPPGVIHVDYAPFSELLPRCAAVVHHGGIGSVAQALAAGCPQLVQPFAHDQLDNAHRLAKLGVARWVVPKKYKPQRVARELRALIESADVAEACKNVAARMKHGDGLKKACELIEGLRAPVTPPVVTV